ncbi:MAG: phage holin family protein [Acidimicrobiales bacterium]
MTQREASPWIPPPSNQNRRWVWRVIVVWAAQAAVLLLLAELLQGLSVETLGVGIVSVLVIGLLDALVWPFVVRFTVTLMALTVGLFSFVMNGVVVWLASVLVPGFEIETLWTGLVVAVTLATVSGLLGSVLSLDDDDAWRRTVVRRAIGDRHRHPVTDVPGVLFIQIDGLSYELLREAVAAGYAPTIGHMIEVGGHRPVQWECDLSSQTGAMQAGIMFGNNWDMPAFRWFDKGSGRVLVSNSPKNAAEIEQNQSSGNGLLAGGASRGNVFSGDAEDALYTFSRWWLGEGPTRQRLVSLFATPHGLLRILGLFLADVVREIRSARAAEREGVEPHGHRGGIYPLLRASVVVGLTEITSATLAGDVYRGLPVAYVDYVGYDEVAHHSGIRRPEAMDVIRMIDDRIRRVCLGFEDAPRPYEVVVLSDHGQTQGATFLQRYGLTLEQLVEGLATDSDVYAPPVVTEGWGNLNGLLSDVVDDDVSVASRVARRALRKHIRDGEVQLGAAADPVVPEDEGEIIVLASGNLGLISFTEFPARATLEEIETRHRGLIAGLAEHPGIGLVMVRSAADGAGIVFGPDGVHHLATGQVQGVDPLLPFGPNAADHLRRTDRFSNCPDVIVNSFFDPETQEGAAFEELIGFHGGLGGPQTMPFVLAPQSMVVPDAPIVGAEAVHELFSVWLAGLSDRTTGVRS